MSNYVKVTKQHLIADCEASTNRDVDVQAKYFEQLTDVERAWNSARTS